MKRKFLLPIGILLLTLIALVYANSNQPIPEDSVVNDNMIWDDYEELDGWFMDGFEDGSYTDTWDDFNFGLWTWSIIIDNSFEDSKLTLCSTLGFTGERKGGIVSKNCYDIQERHLQVNFHHVDVDGRIGITFASVRTTNNNPYSLSNIVDLYINIDIGWVCFRQKKDGSQTDWATTPYSGDDYRLKFEIESGKIQAFFDDSNDKWKRLCNVDYRHGNTKMYLYIYAWDSHLGTVCIDDIRGTGESWFYDILDNFKIKVWEPNNGNWIAKPDQNFNYKENPHAKLLAYGNGLFWSYYDKEDVHRRYNGEVEIDWIIVGYEDIIDSQGDADNFADIIMVLRRGTATSDRSKYHLIVDVIMGSGSWAKQVRYWNGTHWIDIIKYTSLPQSEKILYLQVLKDTLFPDEPYTPSGTPSEEPNWEA